MLFTIMTVIVAWMVLAAASTAGLAEDMACDGDLVWDACHSACPLVCGEDTPRVCPMTCVAGCGCPRGKWLLHGDGGSCVEECESVIGGESDKHECLSSAGYVWCETVGDCIRPWSTDCPTQKDARTRRSVLLAHRLFVAVAAAAAVLCCILSTRQMRREDDENLPLTAVPMNKSDATDEAFAAVVFGTTAISSASSSEADVQETREFSWREEEEKRVFTLNQ